MVSFTMSVTVLLSVFLLIYPEGLVAKNCEPSDCIPATQCSAAIEKTKPILEGNSSMNVTQLREFFTSIECGVSGHTIKICCSQMARLDALLSELMVPLDMHPNLNLLPESCGTVQWSRILLPIEQNYPWMALIAYGSPQFPDSYFECSGTLINDRYVLTSARCVKDKNIKGVRLGEYDVLRCRQRSDEYYALMHNCSNIFPQDIKVEEIIFHERYRSSRFDVNDIALIRLKRLADFSRPNIEPICLPKSSQLLEKNLTGTLAQVMDWNLGKRSYLYQSEVYPHVYRCTIDTSKIDNCNANDLCVGDLGSALMVEIESNNTSRYNFVQYGMLNEPQGVCNLHTPRDYTDVTKHMKWILDKMRP